MTFCVTKPAKPQLHMLYMKLSSRLLVCFHLVLVGAAHLLQRPSVLHRLRGGGGKADADYLGLVNQGNTCYMNSLLQVLFHIPDFRRAIYSLPTSIQPASQPAHVALEMQRLFYRLQYSAAGGACEVGTEGLTRSFGWGQHEVMVQQDVQEFSRMLCEMLQEYMEESGRPDDVARLFEGTTLNTIRCTRVDFKSEREERWYDLQMPVQGCGGLRRSFGALVKEEKLSGANRYNTRRKDLGRQEARRGARLRALPPVMLLHLKRFEYDVESGSMRKLQQAFRFPTSLRLHRYMAAPPAPPQYTLLAVLSHVGHFGSGHYVSYVRPVGSSQWFEFDDTRVSAVPEHVAVRRQYGGRHSTWSDARFGAAPNAYMLVYTREGAGEAEPDASLLPREVRAAFERELGAVPQAAPVPSVGK